MSYDIFHSLVSIFIDGRRRRRRRCSLKFGCGVTRSHLECLSDSDRPQLRGSHSLGPLAARRSHIACLLSMFWSSKCRRTSVSMNFPFKFLALDGESLKGLRVGPAPALRTSANTRGEARACEKYFLFASFHVGKAEKPDLYAGRGPSPIYRPARWPKPKTVDGSRQKPLRAI